jgi:TRAP-type transport system periplasmic protein
MRSYVKLIAAAAGLSFVFAVGAQAQTITWQDHKVLPAGFWSVANEIAFVKKVEEATGGKLKITVFPGGSAGFKDRQVLDALSENLLPMGEVFGGHAGGQEPVMELMDLPQFVPGDNAFRFKLWDALRPLYADLLKKKYGLYLYDVMQLNPRRLYTKTPVKSLADLKGLKIRAIGPADAAFVRALGAEATTTNWGELYTALQQKVVDGHMAADGPHLSMKFHEVTEYIYDTANAGPSFFILINEKAMAKLPADVKDTLLKMRPQLTEANRASYASLDPKARAALIERGMKVNAVSDADLATMRKVGNTIVEQWAAKLRPDARPIYETARKMIDAHYASGGK